MQNTKKRKKNLNKCKKHTKQEWKTIHNLSLYLKNKIKLSAKTHWTRMKKKSLFVQNTKKKLK